MVGSQLRLTGLKKGNCFFVNVYDSVSAEPITKSVTVVDVSPFSTTAPASGITLEKDATVTYAVGGGVKAPSFPTMRLWLMRTSVVLRWL